MSEKELFLSKPEVRKLLMSHFNNLIPVQDN